MVSSGVNPILPNRMGAIEPYVYGLAKSLAATNEVDVFGVGSGRVTEGNLNIYGMANVQALQRSLSKMLDWRIAYYLPFNSFVLKNILELHLKNPIDVLHIHEIYTGFSATISKLSLGIPYVCSIHNEVRTTSPIYSCEKALAVSGYIKNSLIGQGRFDKSHVAILNIAIDVNAFQPAANIEQTKQELGLKNRKVILFVGRKCPEKGPQILVDALPKIVEKNTNVTAVFIGPDLIFGSTTYSSSYAYTQHLESKAKRLGLEGNVIFKSFIPDAVKKMFYAAADVVVFPSIWQEPAGIVLLEAMAASKPLVATDVGGVTDFVQDKINGLIIPPSDPNQLAESVNFLLDNPRYALTLGKNGRKIVEQNFSFYVITQRCLQIYEKII